MHIPLIQQQQAPIHLKSTEKWKGSIDPGRRNPQYKLHPITNLPELDQDKCQTVT